MSTHGPSSTLSPLIAVALLAAWIGATLLVAAIVAPAAFAVLPSRTLAGALIGRVLPPVFWSGILIGAIAWLCARGLGSHAVGRGLAAATLVASCAAAQLVVAPRIDRIRAAVGGPLDLLDAADPRRIAFGRLHAASVGWMGLAAVCAALFLFLIIRSVLHATRADDTMQLSLSTSPSHG
jgi:hypothetical protein